MAPRDRSIGNGDRVVWSTAYRMNARSELNAKGTVTVRAGENPLTHGFGRVRANVRMSMGKEGKSVAETAWARLRSIMSA
jgi:hypothetical protein